MKKILIPIFALFITGCGNDTLPKPNAYLRLNYPKASYKKIETDLPFSFEKNNLAQPISKIKKDSVNNSYSVTIDYPKLKGTVYLNYKKVTKNNLKSLLLDAQNLTQKHTIKADEIQSLGFENPDKNVYGMFYEVCGNAASQSQFYATDSTNHFLSGSLYFYAKPNYDSIYPAAIYLKNDIKRVIESLEWRY